MFSFFSFLVSGSYQISVWGFRWLRSGLRVGFCWVQGSGSHFQVQGLLDQC